MRPAPTLTRVDLARAAIAQTLFAPISLPRALTKLGFVQADPIRAPARAQDLILWQRVSGYRAGDLARRYGALAIEEDYLVNYGFVARAHLPLMHPRAGRRVWTTKERARADAILELVRARGEAGPEHVEALFPPSRVRNAWGGTSRASTQLLDAMHHRGLLRVARRQGGARVYAEARPHVPLELAPRARAERLLQIALSLYGPVPERSLGTLASALRCGAPHLQLELRAAAKALRTTLPHATVDGVRWVWPEGSAPHAQVAPGERVRLLAPFDPLVWDRRRFELLWGWAYRFEAYTPIAKRVRGYYALPLLWRDQVIGWANVDARGPTFGYVTGSAPTEPAFARELEVEVTRLRMFLDATERAP